MLNCTSFSQRDSYSDFWLYNTVIFLDQICTFLVLQTGLTPYWCVNAIVNFSFAVNATVPPAICQSTCSTESQLTWCNSRLWVESGWWRQTFVLWYQCSGNSPPLWRKTSRGDAVKGSSVCLWLTAAWALNKSPASPATGGPLKTSAVRNALDLPSDGEEREGWRGIRASRSLTTLLSLRLLTCFHFFSLLMAVRSLETELDVLMGRRQVELTGNSESGDVL